MTFRIPLRLLAVGVTYATMASLAGPLHAQTIPDGAATLEGELVRFPDGRVNVSIFSPGIETVPPSVWARIEREASVALLQGGGAELNEAVFRHLSAILPGERLRSIDDPSELDPVGVQVTPEGTLRIAWYDLDESEGVAILAAGREVDPLFTLRILIPNPTETEDWWGLQAALSQAGIRRVQILSGDP